MNSDNAPANTPEEAQLKRLCATVRALGKHRFDCEWCGIVEARRKTIAHAASLPPQVRPKNDDMRIVALTTRIREAVGDCLRRDNGSDVALVHGTALGLATLVVRDRNASAIKMVEAIGVEWVDLWPGIGG